MARAAQREQSESSTASRIAARRRETTSERAPKVAAKSAGKSAKGAKGKSVRGKGRPSSIGRLIKLALLVAAFLSIGFFVVLVVDVGASLVGSVKLGPDTTIGALWDKVVARVLDEDVPRPVERPAGRLIAPPKPRVRPTPVVERAPVEAARPEEDAQHVDTRSDPETERAKRRLDEILGRL